MRIFVTAILIFASLIFSMVLLENRLHNENDALYEMAQQTEEMIAKEQIEGAKVNLKALKKDFLIRSLMKSLMPLPQE